MCTCSQLGSPCSPPRPVQLQGSLLPQRPGGVRSLQPSAFSAPFALLALAHPHARISILRFQASMYFLPSSPAFFTHSPSPTPALGLSSSPSPCTLAGGGILFILSQCLNPGRPLTRATSKQQCPGCSSGQGGMPSAQEAPACSLASPWREGCGGSLVFKETPGDESLETGRRVNSASSQPMEGLRDLPSFSLLECEPRL